MHMYAYAHACTSVFNACVTYAYTCMHIDTNFVSIYVTQALCLDADCNRTGTYICL
jgi:hypothetical protein